MSVPILEDIQCIRRPYPTRKELDSNVTKSAITDDSTVLTFDSTQTPAYVTLQSNKMAGLPAGSVTVMAWIKTSYYNTGEITIVGADFPGDLISTSLYLKIVNGNYVFGNFGPSRASSVTTQILPGDDRFWVHLCGQYDGTSTGKRWTLYRNGFFAASASGAGYTPTDAPWYVGGRPNGSALNCKVEIRSVWVFGSLISQSSLQQFYIPIFGVLPSVPPSTDNLTAYWPLNEGSGTIINDLSQVNPLANGSFSSSTITWGSNFTLNGVAIVFVNQGSDVAQIVNGQTTRPVRFFIDIGDYNTTQTLIVSDAQLFGSGPGATTIIFTTPDGVYGGGAMVDMGSASNIAGLRQIELQASSGSMVDSQFPFYGFWCHGQPCIFGYASIVATNNSTFVFSSVAAVINDPNIPNDPNKVSSITAYRSNFTAQCSATYESECAIAAYMQGTGTFSECTLTTLTPNGSDIRYVITLWNTLRGGGCIVFLYDCIIQPDQPSGLSLFVSSTGDFMEVYSSQINGRTVGNVIINSVKTLRLPGSNGSFCIAKIRVTLQDDHIQDKARTLSPGVSIELFEP